MSWNPAGVMAIRTAYAVLTISSTFLMTRKLYFSLNLTGTCIWHGLKQGLSLREISQRLQDEFQVEAEQADHSVLTLVEELVSQELVQDRG